MGVEPTALPDDVPFSSLPKPGDDLDVVEVVLALEEEFHIEIPDAALQTVASTDAGFVAHSVTVAHLAALVDQRLEAH